MADRFDAIERLELLLDGRLAPFSRAAERAMDELDGLEDATGGFDLPDFAETAGAEALDELVARNRLRLRVGSSGHQHGPDAGGPKETNGSRAQAGESTAFLPCARRLIAAAVAQTAWQSTAQQTDLASL